MRKKLFAPNVSRMEAFRRKVVVLKKELTFIECFMKIWTHFQLTHFIGRLKINMTWKLQYVRFRLSIQKIFNLTTKREETYWLLQQTFFHWLLSLHSSPLKLNMETLKKFSYFERTTWRLLYYLWWSARSWIIPMLMTFHFVTFNFFFYFRDNSELPKKTIVWTSGHLWGVINFIGAETQV